MQNQTLQIKRFRVDFGFIQTRKTLKKAFQRVRIVQRGTKSLESSKCM